MLNILAGIISSLVISSLFFYISFFVQKKIQLSLLNAIVYSVLVFFVLFVPFLAVYITRRFKKEKKLLGLERILTEKIINENCNGLSSDEAFSLAKKLIKDANENIDILIMSGSNFSKSFLKEIKEVVSRVNIRICLMHPKVSFKMIKMICEAYGKAEEKNNWIKDGFERTRAVDYHIKETITTYKSMLPKDSKIDIHYIRDFAAFQGLLIDKEQLIVSSHFLKPEKPGYQQEWLYFDKSKGLNSEQIFIFNIFNNLFELEYFNGIKAL